MYESRYTDIIAYENYLLDLELQQSDMTRYVNECVLLSGTDKRKAIEEMAIFNEGALGDKFKKVWARIKSFFAKIYQKFLESLQAWASDNIAYLKQYGNIILEKKCKIKNAKMQDHFEGLKLYRDKFQPNVKTIFTQVPNFENLNKIADDLAKTTTETNKTEKGQEAVDAYTVAQQKVVVDALGDQNLHDPNDTAGFGGRIRNWLNGGETIEDFSGAQLEENMENMYNFLYRYDATVEGLKKIKESFDQGMTNIENAYKKGFDAMSKKVKDKLTNGKNAEVAASRANAKSGITAGDDIGTEIQKAQKDANDASKELKRNTQSSPINSAYSYVYGKVITEADVSVDNSSSNNSSKTVSGGGAGKDPKNLDAVNKADRKSDTDVNKTVRDDTATGKTIGTGAGADAASKLAARDGVKNEDLANYENNALAMVRAWGNARSICMGAALNMLTDTRKDYMDIIRAHVRSWVGQTAGPDQNVDTKPGSGTQYA